MLGILPMAGKGSRWGGYYKELLPVYNKVYVVDYAITAMEKAGVKKFLIITNPEKIQEHARHFSRDKYEGLDFMFVLQKGEELISAINTAIDYSEDINLFAMPDTCFDLDSFDLGMSIFKDIPNANFLVGLFRTDRPERFGCLIDSKFVDKPKNINLDSTYDAWGNFIFRGNTVKKANTLDEFMNINNEHIYYEISYYYDLASFFDYENFLASFHSPHALVTYNFRMP